MLCETATLDVELQYGIATLRFHPGNRWLALAVDMRSAIRTLRRHPAVDVLVLRDFALLPRHEVVAEAGNSEQAWRLSQLGQQLTSDISALPFPTVAFLDGPCVGPALEIALACQWRVASGQLGTKLAVGGVSCWGGCTRLQRLLGRNAACAILSGATHLSGGRSFAHGLVDHVWQPRMAETHLLALELALQANPQAPSAWSRWARRVRAPRISRPSALPVWLVRAMRRGRRFGPAEALAIERAAARAAFESRDGVDKPLRVAA